MKFSKQKINSTESPLHTYLHELVHSEAIGKVFQNQLFKPLTKEQQKVASQVSGYANMSAKGLTEEVRTEIRTKQILRKYFPEIVPELSTEEKKLLDYLS